MEGLDDNPLYKALMTSFKRDFETACRMSCIIAIPTTNSLDGISINQFFVNSHILMPSKLLKMHFTPLQVGYCEDLEIEGQKLVIYLDRKPPMTVIKIEILAQEIGYNVNNKEYRILLIEKPLSNTNKQPLIRSLLSPLMPGQSSKPIRLATRIRPSKPLQNHDDCLNYLEIISQQLTRDLETDVRHLQRNYLILPHYLDDASRRIKSLIENHVPKYEKIALDEDANLILYESIRQAIWLAVENYVIYMMHGKLMPPIQSLNRLRDKMLGEKFIKLRNSKQTLCQLGAQKEFADFVISDDILNELKRLPNLQSPLALVSSLVRLVDLISEALRQSVRFKHLMGDGETSGERVIICSDDLIATFVYSLAQTMPANLYSVAKYLDMFGFSSSAKDQAAYYTATFQIVIQYIIRYESELDSNSSDRSRLLSLSTKKGISNRQRLYRNINPSMKQPNTRQEYKTRFLDSLESRASNNTELNSHSPSPNRGLEEHWQLL